MICLFKRKSFNDRLYMLNFISVWIFVCIGIVVTLFSGKLGIVDLSVLSTAIPCAFAELGIHTGFIVWKAKNENIRKFGKKAEESEEVQ